MSYKRDRTLITNYMKAILIGCAMAIIAGCSSQTAKIQQNSNAVVAPQRAEKLQTTTAHTTENQTPAPEEAVSAEAPKSKWTQGGEPIDTSKFDAQVISAELAFKAEPANKAAKANLAEAYFERGFALTEARQYAAALGDYRRALKLDPDHEESKKWVAQIIGIYEMMKKDYPKEGEEPSALPFKKS